MNTSIIVGSIALVLAGLLATGHAFGRDLVSTPLPTAQEKMDQREVQLEACRAAYRKL